MLVLCFQREWEVNLALPDPSEPRAVGAGSTKRCRGTYQDGVGGVFCGLFALFVCLLVFGDLVQATGID